MASINRPMRHPGGSEPNPAVRRLAADYRVRLGAALTAMRQERGLTQEEVGAVLGVDGNRVSTFEIGRASVNAIHLATLCDLYQQDRHEFGKLVLRYTNPWIYALLFETKGTDVAKDLLSLATEPKHPRKTPKGPK